VSNCLDVLLRTIPAKMPLSRSQPPAASPSGQFEMLLRLYTKAGSPSHVDVIACHVLKQHGSLISAWPSSRRRAGKPESPQFEPVPKGIYR